MTTASTELVVGGALAGAGLRQPHLDEDLVGVQRRGQGIDEEVRRCDLTGAGCRPGDHRGATCQSRSGLIRCDVGVRQRTTRGAPVPDLDVTRPCGRLRQRLGVGLDEAVARRLCMTNQGTDRDRIAVVGDGAEPVDAADVDHRPR